jgi:class III poly(R)-hydroxyalkanoic acid synthase PhaE subunit
MDDLLDAQRRWLESWGQLGQPADGTAFYPFLPGMMGQWQAAVQQSAATLSEAAGATGPAVAAQMALAQEQTLRMLSLVTEAWKTLASGAGNPLDWQAQMAGFTEQARRQMMEAMTQAMPSSPAMGDAATLAQEQLAAWLQPWSAAMRAGAAGAAQGKGWDVAAAAGLDAFTATAGNALSAPALGLNRNQQMAVNRWVRATAESRLLEVRYQSAVSEAWAAAFRSLMEKLVTRTQMGRPVASVRGLMDLWVEVADQEFFKLFHTEAFAALQGAYLNASMQVKKSRRELTEHWLRANDMPTQGDIDAAHKEIYELRKLVKALQKQVTQLAALTPAATAASVAATVEPTRAVRRKKPASSNHSA